MGLGKMIKSTKTADRSLPSVTTLTAMQTAHSLIDIICPMSKQHFTTRIDRIDQQHNIIDLLVNTPELCIDDLHIGNPLHCHGFCEPKAVFFQTKILNLALHNGIIHLTAILPEYVDEKIA